MNILVTGAKGMVGQALVANLKNIRDGKNRTRPALKIEEIYEYDIDSTEAELDEYCKKTDFVFNLAGVNRPKDNAEFMQENCGFSPICYAYPFGQLTDGADALLQEMGFRITLTCNEEKSLLTSGQSNCLFSLGRYNRDGRISTEEFMTKLLEQS